MSLARTPFLVNGFAANSIHMMCGTGLAAVGGVEIETRAFASSALRIMHGTYFSFRNYQANFLPFRHTTIQRIAINEPPASTIHNIAACTSARQPTLFNALRESPVPMRNRAI